MLRDVLPPRWRRALAGLKPESSTSIAGLPAAVVPFPGKAIRGLADYQDHRRVQQSEYERRRSIEHALIPRDGEAFEVPGTCAVCSAQRSFHVSFLYAYDRTDDGRTVPNWREHLVCRCGFANRVRAALHYLLGEIAPPRDAAIFITEQTTPLYAWLKTAFPGIVGSEYMGSGLASGTQVRGYRHEDLMSLSFPDNSFDAVLSFDVLEHVADSAASFKECLRCLKPGGVMLFTAPFTMDRERDTVRAIQRVDGLIDHLEPPEYHGNPIDPEGGSLCFRYFGWQMLADMRSFGFEDPRAIVYWSRELGYLGGEQVLFVASKPR